MGRRSNDDALPAVRVELLGPLRLRVSGEVVDVPGPKRRALLALLAAAEGRSVSADDLIDTLWPAELPESARRTLHSHVSRLRRHLGAAGPALESTPAGYRLRAPVEGHLTDAAEARSVLAASAGAAPADALEALRQARDLWRGDALAEFADVARLAAAAVTLRELKRGIAEAFAAAALDAGRPADAVEAAAALVAEEPLSEAAVILSMRALEGAGRPADALRAGHRFRRRLAEETGLEPSAALAEVEHAVAARSPGREGRIPRPAGRLWGRSAELAALRRLLGSERLVTVLGPGGVGKTRLAVAAAAGADDAVGVWLSSIEAGADVAAALAAALELRVIHGDPLDACAALLAAGPHLLLVDNCEHVAAGVRKVVAALLDACPELTVLATSREPLRLTAEQQLRISPLALTGTSDAGELDRSPAVALFVERARRVRPDFDPTGGDLVVIADVVRRLDGMPLAIELAAGRLSSLELGDLTARLDRKLDLLGDAAGSSLRRTLEWSYGLLPEPEQRLFRHLSVFPDGFDLDTAESVASSLDLAGNAGGATVAVTRLADASMMDVTLGSGARYRMLDTIRTFATEQLIAEGEMDEAVERFLNWARTYSQRISELVGEDEERADRLLRRELGTLRSAWSAMRERGRLDDAAALVVDLSDPAGWRDLTEIWAWGIELAEDPRLAGHPEAAAVLGLAAVSAWNRGDLQRAERLARKGLGIGGEGAWRCTGALALVALSQGDLAGSAALGVEAFEAAPLVDQSLGVAALAEAYRGDLDRAADLNTRLATADAPATIGAFSAYIAAEIDTLAGRNADAEANYRYAIDRSAEVGATFVEGIAWVGLLTLRARGGRVADALDGYRSLIDYWERTGGWPQQWTTLRNLARLLRSLDDDATATALEEAAASAPDAPAVVAAHADGRTVRTAPGKVPGRTRVVEIAREAIDVQRRRIRPAPTA